MLRIDEAIFDLNSLDVYKRDVTNGVAHLRVSARFADWLKVCARHHQALTKVLNRG